MSLILARPTGAKLVYAKTYVGIDDPDAATYIAAVETADGQSLETAVKVAIHSFVKGCKADGIWPAIKASCILAGARTLNGALVPLAGTAPTNFNFVSGDYNRKTGLVGDGSTKYLNSNRNNNSDPQNSQHLSVYASSAPTAVSGNIAYIGAGIGDTGASQIFSNRTAAILEARSRIATAAPFASTSDNSLGLIGITRSTASGFSLRASNVTYADNARTSEAPFNGSILVFNRSTSALYSDARLAFYSIGESLNLALLDARVTDLINAFGAAIP